MRKLRILFHKIPAGWAGLWYGIRHPVSGGIALVTRSRYTHVEVWTSDKDNQFIRRLQQSGLSPKQYLGTCWTSTLRDEYDGACERPAAKVLKNPDRWDYLEFECKDKDYNKMVKAMDEAVDENKGYDVVGVGRFLIGIPVFNKTKYWCNEFCRMAMMNLSGVWVMDKRAGEADWFAPVELFATLKGKGITPKRFAKILPGKMKQLA